MEIKDTYSRNEIEKFLYAAAILSTQTIIARELFHIYQSKDVIENIRNKIAPYREKEYTQFKTISKLLENIDETLFIQENSLKLEVKLK